MYIVWLFSPATAVSLTDNSFPADEFKVLHGLLSVKWKAIAPYPTENLITSNIKLFLSHVSQITPTLCIQGSYSFITSLLLKDQINLSTG